MANLHREFLTVEELADLLQVKPSWVYSHADDLGVSRLGKYLRFYWPRVLESLALHNASGLLERIDPQS